MSIRWRPLPPAVRRAMVLHARREAPRECCGFLIGQQGQQGRVKFSLAMSNAARGTTEYRIDDREHIEVRRWLRRVSPALEIVGVYHSHPAGAAVPSARDCAEANYPNWLSVIVGLGHARPSVGLFTIARGKARRVRPGPGV